MIIKKFELHNFQVIKEFSGNFEGGVYFITGDNEVGKSTLLKAIGIMLTGERDDVLKKGEKKGFAKMVIGDDGENYDVELKFTEANPRGTISIKSQKTGMKSDNVSMLQKIFGYTDFDAVEFSRWSETAEGRRKQVEVVKSLLPKKVQDRINTIDKDLKTEKESRKEANSQVKTYTAICQSAESEIAPGDIKTYAKSIDVTDLMKEQTENAQLIEKAKGVRLRLKERSDALSAIPLQRESAQVAYNARIAELQKLMDEAKVKFDSHVESLDSQEAELKQNNEKAEKWLKAYDENNPEETDTATKLLNAEQHNKKHAKVSDYLTKKEQLTKAEKVANTHDEKISSLQDERAALIAKSKLPIPGLTFSEDGLELNNIPFTEGKVSDSQIMEVAAKLIIASNPTVKVFRIARGESLGEKRLKAIIEVAEKNGFQGFIEEVKRGQDDLAVEEYTEV